LAYVLKPDRPHDWPGRPRYFHPSLSGERPKYSSDDIVRFEPRILRRDIKRFNVAANSQQAVWVIVQVPVDAKPGKYQGVVEVCCGNETRKIPLTLAVYAFTLSSVPHTRTLTSWRPHPKKAYEGKTQYYPQDEADKVARFVIRYRWSPGRLYQKWQMVPPPTAETIRRWTDWGGRDVNLVCVANTHHDVTTDPETGLRIMKRQSERRIFNHLDKVVPSIREAGLLGNCYIYGFDERSRRAADYINRFFSRVKERYHGIRTAIATNQWTALDAPQVRTVDMWFYSYRSPTRELRELHHDRREEIGYYNPTRETLVPARVQFWALYKDGLDGVLYHYLNFHMAFWSVYEQPFPLIEKVDLSTMHFLDDGPTSTTILETWPDGLEDVDYLHVLDEQVRRVSKLAERRQLGEAVTKLLAQAKYYDSVPDSVTLGIFEQARTGRRYHGMWNVLGRQECSSIEASLIARQHTDSMAHIMYVRSRIAGLIEKLSEIETADDIK